MLAAAADQREEIVAASVALAHDLDGAGGLAAVLAHRAASICLRNTGDSAASIHHADRGVDTAATLRDPIVESEARLTRALTAVMQGDGHQALQDADAAVDLATRHALAQARAHAQRALIRMRLGDERWDEDFQQALPILEDAGDGFWCSLAHLNRGAALLLAGRLDDARRDLQAAAAIQLRLGNTEGLALARHNLGMVESRTGNLAAALLAYDDAAARLEALGIATGPGVVNRAETLAAAGLLGEARVLLSQQVGALAAEQPALVPEARLLLARVLHADNRAQDALTHARDAVTGFEEQQRPGWALLARGVEALIALDTGAIDPADGLRLAASLADDGWPDVALEVTAAAALRSVRIGDIETATTALDRMGQDRMPVAASLLAVQARMAIADHRGDPQAALSAAQQALERLDDQRALLGASELRAHVTGLAASLLDDATRIALGTGDARVALAWVDQARAQALDQPPVVPPEDDELAADLGRLRVLIDDLTRRRAAGEPVGPLDAERATLEQRIRDRARMVSGTSGTSTGPRAGPPRLSGTTEVAYHDVDGSLVALVADDHGTRRVDLPVDRLALAKELDAVGFAMQRVGSAREPGRRQEIAQRSLTHSLDTLDAALVAPLGLGDVDGVVVSPTDALFEVPWSGLPGLVGRAVAVTPALRLARRPGRDGHGTGTLLAEGPRLAHARAELDALARVADGPRPLLGDEATVAAVREALAEVAVAHLACHGVFRDDNPQFSSLELADGPMFVYDLESVARVPDLIVLSACQTGRSSVHAGGELLGVTASLLALGARTVVAALADVPDDLSALLMLAFHQHLAAGARPAEALARARTTLLASRPEPAALLTCAAFSCLGAP
jgi:tetratricopeptide (TPR) repeat protein